MPSAPWTRYAPQLAPARNGHTPAPHCQCHTMPPRPCKLLRRDTHGSTRIVAGADAILCCVCWCGASEGAPQLYAPASMRNGFPGGATCDGNDAQTFFCTRLYNLNVMAQHLLVYRSNKCSLHAPAWAHTLSCAVEAVVHCEFLSLAAYYIV